MEYAGVDHPTLTKDVSNLLSFNVFLFRSFTLSIFEFSYSINKIFYKFLSTIYNVNPGLYKNLHGFTPSFTLFLGSIKAFGNGEIVECNLFSNCIIFLNHIIIS